MLVKCRDITNIVEEIAPLNLALKQDNVGLLIGNEDAMINSVLVSLDVNNDVIDEAVNNNCSLIITHHPVIFSPLKSINVRHYKEKMIHSIISKGISVYSAHTNLDICDTGINTYITQKLELVDVSVLEKTYEEKLYKIAVYVPEGYEDKVWEAMVRNGAGSIGNYSCCTFNISGQGTFMPLDGSNPFLGSMGHTERVRETKIESIVNQKALSLVVNNMIKAHPYEEPAYDLYPLMNNGKVYGLGRVGYLKNSISLKELCLIVKDIFDVSNLSVTGDLERTVKKIAICSGSGGSLIQNAHNSGCDAYITGDIKYHDACDARDMGIAVIDAGHFATENLYMNYLYSLIKDQAAQKGYDIAVKLSKVNKNPYCIV